MCKREAEERKKKLLAAYDVAARSAPAGAFRAIDMATIDGEFLLSDSPNSSVI